MIGSLPIIRCYGGLLLRCSLLYVTDRIEVMLVIACNEPMPRWMPRIHLTGIDKTSRFKTHIAYNFK